MNDLIAIFIGAFFASFGHCVGMCGGIVLGFNMKGGIQSNSANLILRRATFNFTYFIGRLSSYIIVGLIFTFISSAFSYGVKTNGIIFLVFGILLIISAFLFTFAPIYFSKIFNFSFISNLNIYKKGFSYALKSTNILGSYLLGILNGFLPCGLVYMYALHVSSYGSITFSIIGMIAFGLGTFLTLFSFGMISGSLISAKIFGIKIRELFLNISFLIMIYFGATNIYEGWMILTTGEGSHHHHDMNMVNHSHADHTNHTEHTDHNHNHTDHTDHTDHNHNHTDHTDHNHNHTDHNHNHTNHFSH